MGFACPASQEVLAGFSGVEEGQMDGWNQPTPNEVHCAGKSLVCVYVAVNLRVFKGFSSIFKTVNVVVCVCSGACVCVCVYGAGGSVVVSSVFMSKVQMTSQSRPWIPCLPMMLLCFFGALGMSHS